MGIPAVKCVAIKPRMPNVGIRVMPRVNPVIKDIIASLRVRLVFPWLLIRFAVLRYPRPVYRCMIMYNVR